MYEQGKGTANGRELNRVEFEAVGRKLVGGKALERREILEILRDYRKESAERYEILTIGLFGSVARGEAGGDSDVDVVAHISEPDLFMLAGIKSDLEERLHQRVDLVAYTEGMNRFLKKRIDEDAVYA